VRVPGLSLATAGVVVTLALGGVCRADTPAPTSPPAAPGNKPLHAAELLALHPTGGTFTVTGYVAYLYRCPPCPKGAQCKPCMGDNFVLSDSKKNLSSYADLGPKDLIVLASEAQLAKLFLRQSVRVRVEVLSRCCCRC